MAGTVVAVQRGQRGRVQVLLDQGQSLSLHPLVAQGAELQPGRFLSDDDLAALQERSSLQLALDRALRYLSYRSRSEKEVRDHLLRHQTPPELAEQVIGRLRELHLVDDDAFARLWVEERQRLNPRGQALVRRELRGKGIGGETIEAVAAPDDPEVVYEVARRRARLLDRSDPRAFRRRLSGYLLRRGYDYATVSEVVNRLWRNEAQT